MTGRSKFCLPMRMVSIQPIDDYPLFNTYRDYLVFLSLVRELICSNRNKLYGFSWLSHEAVMLFHTPHRNFGLQLLKVMKRYYYWLQQSNHQQQHFRLQALTLKESALCHDALRYIHYRPTATGQVKDALDYHWNSYPIYQDFWQLNWLSCTEILQSYSLNPLQALESFRAYMQQPPLQDFGRQLDNSNEANNLVQHHEGNPQVGQKMAVGESIQNYQKSHYYLDGIEAHLSNGDLIATVAPLNRHKSASKVHILSASV